MRYPLYLGITATAPATGGSLYLRGLTSGAGWITVANIAGNNIKFQIPSVQAVGVSVLTNDGTGVTSWTSTIDNATIFSKLLQDSVVFTTATKTLALTDANKIINCSTENYQEVTIPAYGTVAFPVGTIISFYINGATVVRVNCAATVKRRTPGNIDSCTMNTVFGTYQIKQVSQDIWLFIGDWRD
jgi:hypothetical protein